VRAKRALNLLRTEVATLIARAQTRRDAEDGDRARRRIGSLS
jgi:hypothetical protein